MLRPAPWAQAGCRPCGRCRRRSAGRCSRPSESPPRRLLWATGRGDDHDAHFAVQRWWADRLVGILHRTAGLTFEVDGLDILAPGPIVICAQHASLADALIPVWLLGQAGMRPRSVLKDDLQLDPCLDVVGNRLPNHFVDREPERQRPRDRRPGTARSRTSGSMTHA